MRAILSASATCAALAMSPSPASARSADILGVDALFADYGFSADRRDERATAALFERDAQLSIPAYAVQAVGRDAIASTLRGIWKAVEQAGQQRRHMISGVRVIDGPHRSRLVRAVFSVTGTPREGKPQIYMTGYYEGEVVRDGSHWRFRRLTINVDSAANP